MSKLRIADQDRFDAQVGPVTKMWMLNEGILDTEPDQPDQELREWRVVWRCSPSGTMYTVYCSSEENADYEISISLGEDIHDLHKQWRTPAGPWTDEPQSTTDSGK